MIRRKYIRAISVGLAFLSGCISSGGEKEPEVNSTIEVSNRFCDGSDPFVSINSHTTGEIRFDGVIEKVPENYGLDTIIYASPGDESVVCKIRSSEQWDTQSLSCSGSVGYSGVIEYSNMKISEVWFIHTIDGDQGLGRTIKTKAK